MTDIYTLSTPFLPPVKLIHDDIANDKKIMLAFGKITLAIKNGKYKNHKLKQRLKLEATKNQFIDAKLGWWCNKIHTIIKIKNNLIINYFKHIFSYDFVMSELDKLLDNYIPSKKEEEEIIKKINDMVLLHYSTLKIYLDKYEYHTAIQHHTYFTKKGVYKYYTKRGREFYIKYKKEPWTIS